MTEATLIAVLGLAGTVIGGIGAAIAAAARYAVKLVQERLSRLEHEVDRLRGQLDERDRLSMAHVVRDLQVATELRRLGHDPGSPPPLIPSVHQEVRS
jgi:hypothetical protein